MITDAIFKKYDSDNNGELDESEVKQLLSDICSLTNTNNDSAFIQRFY